MLILNQNEIEKLLSPEEVLEAITQAFTLFHQRQFSMPDRMHTHYGNNTLLLMPCFTKSVFGTKLVSVNPENVSKGWPAINGIMVLNNGETGEALALFNGAALTAIRTGAVGGIGIAHTAPENASSLGIVGTGVQGFTQAVFATKVRPIKEITVLDQNRKKAKTFIRKLENELPNVKVKTCKDNVELLQKSEIIICASSSQTPVLPNNPLLLKGKCFVGIGSYKPEMREMPDALFPLLKKVWIDTPFAAQETGDLAFPLSEKLLKKNQLHPLSELVVNGKTDSSETTFFKSVGMALFDVVVAEYMYEKALKKNVGTKIQL